MRQRGTSNIALKRSRTTNMAKNSVFCIIGYSQIVTVLQRLLFHMSHDSTASQLFRENENETETSESGNN